MVGSAPERLIDANTNVGVPTSQHRQRRYPEWYTRYMDLMSEGIDIEP